MMTKTTECNSLEEFIKFTRRIAKEKSRFKKFKLDYIKRM